MIVLSIVMILDYSMIDTHVTLTYVCLTALDKQERCLEQLNRKHTSTRLQSLHAAWYGFGDSAGKKND